MLVTVLLLVLIEAVMLMVSTVHVHILLLLVHLVVWVQRLVRPCILVGCRVGGAGKVAMCICEACR